jgi:hypothetical protein
MLRTRTCSACPESRRQEVDDHLMLPLYLLGQITKPFDIPDHTRVNPSPCPSSPHPSNVFLQYPFSPGPACQYYRIVDLSEDLFILDEPASQHRSVVRPHDNPIARCRYEVWTLLNPICIAQRVCTGVWQCRCDIPSMTSVRGDTGP